MNCPDCGRPLIFAIYAICVNCRVAYQTHELHGAITRVEREREIDVPEVDIRS